jgi:hypothetical protein
MKKIIYILGAPLSGKTQRARDLFMSGAGDFWIEIDMISGRKPVPGNPHAREVSPSVLKHWRDRSIHTGSSLIISGVCTNYEEILKLCDEFIWMRVRPNIIRARSAERNVDPKLLYQWAKDWYDGPHADTILKYQEKGKVEGNGGDFRK